MKKVIHASSNRKKMIVVILLVILLLITAFAYGLMLGIKYTDKNCTAEQDENEIIDDENDETETPITKIEIASFLSLAINGGNYYDLLMVENNDNSDESIFMKVIKYLVANNIYTKSDDFYIFNQSDIKEVARKYLIKDNFDYQSTNPQFPYDSATQTVSSKIQFDLFQDLWAIVDKKIENYSVNGKEINVNYKVSAIYRDPEGNFNSEGNYSYLITLERIDNELRIINVVSN